MAAVFISALLNLFIKEDFLWKRTKEEIIL
jgi:hypothetical protein